MKTKLLIGLMLVGMSLLTGCNEEINVNELSELLLKVDNAENHMQRVFWENNTYVIFKYEGNCGTNQDLHINLNNCFIEMDENEEITTSTVQIEMYENKKITNDTNDIEITKVYECDARSLNTSKPTDFENDVRCRIVSEYESVVGSIYLGSLSDAYFIRDGYNYHTTVELKERANTKGTER